MPALTPLQRVETDVGKSLKMKRERTDLISLKAEHTYYEYATTKLKVLLGLLYNS